MVIPRATRSGGLATANAAVLTLAVALVTSVVAVETTHAKQVRVFAVGNRLRMQDVASYQNYRDKMFAMMDAAYPGRAGLVQAGVDDVASHIAPSDPFAPSDVLVNFPESVSLAASFIGSRGLGARLQPTSVQAYLALFGSYRKPRNYYNRIYELDPGDIVPQIVMAVTDTIYRAFYETFRDIATTYGVYVTAGADLPPARVVWQSEDPELYDTLIDPDEAGVRDYVYFATSPIPVNTTFVFQPDGEIFIQRDDGTITSSPAGTGGLILGSRDKVYLTPIELNLLKLFDAPIDRLDVLTTPVGRLGIVISKDAWMVDINDRLAARHAHVMIQSEAFSSWAFQTDPWDPDIFKQGGFNNLQKYQTRVYNVAPSLVGNLFEITFDGQSSILERRTKAPPGPVDGTNGWIGQAADTGFAAIAPWVVADPGIADVSLTLAERRTALTAAGAALAPGSGVDCGGPLVFGPCENGYREGVVWADAEIPNGVDVLTTADTTPPVAGSYGLSVQVNDDDDASPSSQLYAQLAAEGERLWVVWQDTRHGNDNIYGAYSSDGGATWSADVKISDDAPGAFVELLPEIAFHRHDRTGVATLYVVWQRRETGGGPRDGRILIAHFDESFAKLSGDVRVDDAPGAGKWHAVVSTIRSRGYPLVVWVDERDSGPGISVFETLRAARARGRRRVDSRPRLRFTKSKPVVRNKEAVPDAAQLANEWAPSITVAGRSAIVAWLDFRNYNWDVFAAVSRRGGLRYLRRPLRVDDSEEFERLNSHPSIAYDADGGRALLVWSDQRSREVDSNIFSAASADGGHTWSLPLRIDGGDVGLDADKDVASNQWQPEVAAAGGRACVAWQDDRFGNNDIFAAVSVDGGVTFALEERVDDSSSGPSEQFGPAVALGSSRCYVVWSDDRSGDADIRFASKSF